MPITPRHMPFLDHITELRRRLMIIAAVVFVGSMVAYAWAPWFFDVVLRPILPLLHGQKLRWSGPFEGFGLRFKVALYMAVIFGSPVIIWQVMAFFLPALKPKERKYVIPTFGAMVGLFALGVFFCWSTVLGAGFGWMLSQGWETVALLPSASQFYQGATLLMIGFGVGFQLPVVVFYLVVFDIVPYVKLREQWRVVYVGLMIVASVATPDWSPVTMGALFGALVVLYELSMFLARTLLRKRIAAQKV